MKPTVLHLTTTAVSLDWLLLPQLQAFAERGYDVVTASAPGDHVESISSAGFRHISIESFSRNMDLRSDTAAWGELGAVLRTVKPAILHTHNPKPGVIGRLRGRWSVPIVVNTVHGLYAQPHDPLRRRMPVYAAERFAATFSDAELVQNPEDVAILERLYVPRNRVHYLGNGIDLDRFSPTPKLRRSARAMRRRLAIAPSTPIIGMIGRLVWEKGYRELFDAVRQLRARNGEAFAVVIVGPDEVGKADAVGAHEIERMRELGVHFVGRRDDVELWHELFDIFVLPSYREGFPRAAMEASALGTPVVASNVRGCRQVVAHDRTGLLVPSRNGPALADALEQLVWNRTLRTEFGAAGRRRALAEFDQDRVIARTEAVYRSLLVSRGLQPPERPSTDRYSASIDLVAAAASNDQAREAAA